ncbi:MAG: PilN domain-containing protein [bacterium]|nr:PilN domain-containing protein [bacterium]
MKPAQPHVRINLFAVTKAKIEFARASAWALTYGRLILILTEFLVIGVFAMRFKLDADIADAYEKLEGQRGIVASLAKIEHQFLDFQGTVNDAGTKLANQHDAASTLFSFYEQLPPGITLDTIALDDKNNVRFQGKASSQPSFTTLYQMLQTSTLLSNVSIGNVSASRDGITFSATAELKEIPQP